jgi:hypothetical protein
MGVLCGIFLIDGRCEEVMLVLRGRLFNEKMSPKILPFTLPAGDALSAKASGETT